MHNKKIAVVPLDNRPCSYMFPYRIGAIAGYEVIEPPVSALGQFTRPGNCMETRQWIEENASSASGLVIAVDQLAYGGLVASRTMDRSLEQCLETLSIIPEIKQAYPELKIFAASVLMRLSITYKNKEYYEYGMMIFKYSQLHDRVHRLGEMDQLEELNRLEKAIPAPVLQEYLDARKRNHEINKLMLDWCAQGIIDYAVITQEDASPYGMHISEQQILMEHLYNHKIQHKAMVYPGADEAVQTLLIRMVQQLENKRAKVYPRYTSTSGRLAIADFEDRPVEETVKCHILAAGAICVEHADEADFVLYVNTPLQDIRPSVQKKAFFNARHNYWDLMEGMKYDLAKGRKVALADVALCNASDLELVQYMLEEGIYLQLLAYAGWNTAGNTLGTVLGHAIAHWVGMQSDDRSSEQAQWHYTFMMERLLDEWAYQAQVREEINRWIASELDVNSNDLEQRYDEVNARVRGLMLAKFAQLRETLLAEARQLEADKLLWRPIDYQINDVYLPWNRTFEIYVDITCAIDRKSVV